ncbi:MAG: hypothetical protein JF598_10730, partial [Streptomyces sp.]|nr:hypothetical protein [Streptomyces sp.]
MTCAELLGEFTSLLCGALAELLVSTGVVEAGPLAELEVVGVVPVGVDVGVSEGFGDSDVDAEGVPGLVGVDGVDGFVVDGLGVVGFGELGVPLPGRCVPLGLSEGSAASVGVGSSEVPHVPSGPGSVGRDVAVPVSPLPSSLFGTSAPRLPSSMPTLADGLTPTSLDGEFGS